jgi:hypothetical protein
MSILILNCSPAGDESITLTGKVEEQNAGAIYGTLTGFSAMKAEQTLNGEFSDEDDSERFSMIGVCTLDPDCASFAIWLYNGELDSVSITVNAALNSMLQTGGRISKTPLPIGILFSVLINRFDLPNRAGAICSPARFFCARHFDLLPAAYDK